MIELVLPYPPTVNRYWKTSVRRGKVHKCIGEKGKQFAEQVFWLVRGMKADKKLEGRLNVEVQVYVPDNKRRDIDNLCKSLLDALQKAGVYKDDEQIDKLSIVRRGLIKGGKTIVTVSEIKE